MDSSMSSDPHAPDVDLDFRADRWRRGKATAAEIKKLAATHEEWTDEQRYAEAVRIDSVSDNVLHEELVTMRKEHEFTGATHAEPAPDPDDEPQSPAPGDDEDEDDEDDDPDEETTDVPGISDDDGDDDKVEPEPEPEAKKAAPVKKAAKKASAPRKAAGTRKRAASTRKG